MVGVKGAAPGSIEVKPAAVTLVTGVGRVEDARMIGKSCADHGGDGGVGGMAKCFETAERRTSCEGGSAIGGEWRAEENTVRELCTGDCAAVGRRISVDRFLPLPSATPVAESTVVCCKKPVIRGVTIK